MKLPILALILSSQLLVGCGTAEGQMQSTGDGLGRMSPSITTVLESTAVSQATAGESTAAPVTREQAEAIALAHAGFTADQVKRLRTEYEIDDGIPRFEVQFRQGRWEYDYEINADTGAILSYDRDD